MNQQQPIKAGSTGTAIMYLAVFAGIVLRFAMPGLKPLSPQEASFAGLFAGKGFLEGLFTSLAVNHQPPLFDILTWIMTSIFGVSEFSLRFLPALFGSAAIFVVQKMTRSFYSERVSILAVSLFALNPFLISISRSCSFASLFLLTSLLMVYYFMLSVKYNSFVMGPFIFWSIAGIYTHHNTLLLLAVLNAVLFLRYREEIRINLWIRSQIYIFLSWLPLCVYLFKGISAGVYPWENQAMLPLLFYREMLLGPELGFNAVTILFMLAASFFLLVGTVTLRSIKEKRMTDIMIITAAILPAVPWIEEIIRKQPYGPQAMALSGALMLILIAVGASHLSRDGTVLFSVITVVFYAWAAFVYFYQPAGAADVRKAYTEISSQYRAGDIIFNTDPENYITFQFYNSHMNGKNMPDRLLAPVPEFKGSKAVRDIWRGIKNFLLEKTGIAVYAGYDRNIIPEDMIENEIAGTSRVWLLCPGGGAETDRPWIKKHFREASRKNAGGADIILLEKIYK
ncbi:MAG: glycosyltransferase family 39 protein [Candidatus Goldiibacteriota bacterium]|jgi:4-amino-4-deoxy-L-arabinose transferase-like glycosyltransferase